MIPGKIILGMGGAMDLVTGAKRVIVGMQHCANGRPKIVPTCTLPLTSVRSVDLLVTELAVIGFSDGRATLLEAAPDVSIEQILAATPIRVEIPDRPPQMAFLKRGGSGSWKTAAGHTGRACHAIGCDALVAFARALLDFTGVRSIAERHQNATSVTGPVTGPVTGDHSPTYRASAMTAKNTPSPTPPADSMTVMDKSHASSRNSSRMNCQSPGSRNACMSPTPC
jgi:hypothetical protein